MNGDNTLLILILVVLAFLIYNGLTGQNLAMDVASKARSGADYLLDTTGQVAEDVRRGIVRTGDAVGQGTSYAFHSVFGEDNGNNNSGMNGDESNENGPRGWCNDLDSDEYTHGNGLYEGMESVGYPVAEAEPEAEDETEQENGNESCGTVYNGQGFPFKNVPVQPPFSTSESQPVGNLKHMAGYEYNLHDSGRPAPYPSLYWASANQN